MGKDPIIEVDYFFRIPSLNKLLMTHGIRGSTVSKVVSTHLWNTPLNLYHQAKKRSIFKGFNFHSWRTGGCALRVCCNFLGLSG